MGDELSEMQAEWRAIVLDKLTSVEQTQKEFKADIIEIKTSFVKQQALETLRETNRNDIEALRVKVEKLENFKYWLIGIVAAVNVVLEIVFHGPFK